MNRSIQYDESFLAMKYYASSFYDISNHNESSLQRKSSSHNSISIDENRMQRMKSATSLKKTFNIVVLHGWGQNGQLGEKTMRRITDRLGKNGIHLTFVSAPHPLPKTSKIQIDGVLMEVNNFPPDRQPFSWFMYNEETNLDEACYVPDDFLTRKLPYYGWLDSVNSIRLQWEQASSSTLDGVLGFSQGATMAHILCSLRCDSAYMKNPDYEWLASLKFGIFAGGFPSRLNPPPAPVDNLPLPSLHFSGKQDVDVPPQFHQELASCFQRYIIHEHEKGHIVPNNSADVSAMLSFISQFKEKTRPEL